MKDWESLNQDMATAFLVEIRRVQQHAKETKVHSHDSLYTGISGIAFMEYHIAGLRLPLQNEILTPKTLLAVADRNLAKVLFRNPINTEYMYSPARLSFIETSIGIATLVAIRGLTTSEQIIVDNWHAALGFLEYTLQHSLAADDDVYSPGDKEDGCEVLYGRGGLLYALLYLRKAITDRPNREKVAFEKLVSDQTLSRLVDSIMARGKHGAHLLSSEFRVNDIEHLPPLMWTWHGKRYLGGAHGIAGILQILLLCPLSIIQKHFRDIFRTISWLVDVQDETGNWPSRCPTQRGVSVDNDLIQWCHGAPGMVILLSTALRTIKKYRKSFMIIDEPTRDKFCRSLQMGAQLVYKQGLLRKGVGLCHGVSGNVYALLAASDILDVHDAAKLSLPSSGEAEPTDMRHYFSQAAHLAFLGKFHDDPLVLPDMCTSTKQGPPDHPWSLFEGLAGMCCAWAEVLSRLDERCPRRERSGFPGFDDL